MLDSGYVFLVEIKRDENHTIAEAAFAVVRIALKLLAQ